MKKFLIIFFAISVLISAQDLKRYQFKSGKVVYQSTGSMVGTETLFFDNYGMREAKYSKVVLDIMGMKQEIDAKTIMEEKWIYAIDNTSNKASKMENPLWEMIPNGTDIEKIGEEMMTNLGGKKIGTEVLLGKTCDIWEVEQMMSKIWIWKSIPLKSEVNAMGMTFAQIATSVEVDIPVSADEFKLPEGIEIQEINADDLNGMMGN